MENLAHLKNAACSAIDLNAAGLRVLSKDIHDHPELGYQEFHAHEALTAFLENHGFHVERSFKLPTAFRAVTGKAGAGPNVAVMCEYDALPGLGHACGHNLIAELGVATALGIKAAMEASEKPLGLVTVLGSPAEEGGGGKIDLLQLGTFDIVDVAMMAHPSQCTLSKPVYVAMTQVTVDYKGQASHASSFPWNGINALDAAVLCYQNISCLRQHMKPTWRVHGVITKGGEKPNIIPDSTQLVYYVRTPTDEELQQLKAKVISCMEAAAVATGCQVEMTFDPKPYSSLMSNGVMANLFEENGRAVGMEFEADPSVLTRQGGSTDMGNVSRALPSIHPKYDIGTLASAHSAEFARVAGLDTAHQATLAVAKALALTALDIYVRPCLLPDIKMEFQNSIQGEKST